VDFDLVLRESDVISIHAPLVKSTYHMIGKGEIDKMKDGVILLNLGRGGIIDEEALYCNLKSGKIKGFAADVLEKEPPGKNKLFELPNVLVTPHIGASTYEAQRMISEQIAEEILEFFKRGKLVQQSA
jgi:D-3-phosphoglycerate dehydrogenase